MRCCSFAVGWGGDFPVAGGSDPQDDAWPEVFQVPSWCLFESVVAAAEHCDVAGAGRAALVERGGVVGVAVSYGSAAAWEAAAAIAVFDQTPHRGR
jgi:hypothetical protein